MISFGSNSSPAEAASAGELLEPEDIIHPLISVTITGSMPGELLDPEGIIHPQAEASTQ
jgi:hypothetical protein